MELKGPVNKDTYSIIVELAERLEAIRPVNSGNLFRVAARLAFERADFEKAKEHSIKAMSIFERFAESNGVDTEMRFAIHRFAAMAARDAGETAKAKQLLHMFVDDWKDLVRDRASPEEIEMIDRSMIPETESGEDGVYAATESERQRIEHNTRKDTNNLYRMVYMVLSHEGFPSAAEEIANRIGQGE